jgi:hypothetical protein
MRAYYAFIVLVVGITMPLFSYAQFGTGALSGSSPQIKLDPAFPEPREEVTVSLENFLSSYYTADIQWLYAGNEVPDSANQREITLTAGELGSNQTITANILKADGTQETIRHTIAPVYLDIVVEPQTHVPDFYKGRALPSVGGIVNLISILNGTNEGSENLIYTWRVNNEVVNGAGARGQYRASFVSSLDTQTVVSLDVTRLNGERVAKRSFILTNVRPTITFYEIHPLYGLSQLPLERLLFSGNTATIQAEPYYLDSRIYNTPDIADWNIDGFEIERRQNPYQITLQRVSTNGNSTADFQVQSTTNLLQGAKESLSITY